MTIWHPDNRSWRERRRRSVMTETEKIIERLEKRSIIDPSTGCKLWQGGRHLDRYGNPTYGQTTYHGRSVTVHGLVMHLLTEFSLGSEEQINHIKECPNKHCWEIKHLYIGNQQDNMNDLEYNNTHCPAGHPYTVENTYYWYDRKRGKVTKTCKTCKKQR